MPQTEEEHLENQNLDYDDHEKTHPDAEVRPTFRYIDFFQVSSMVFLTFLGSTLDMELIYRVFVLESRHKTTKPFSCIIHAVYTYFETTI